MPRLRLTLEWKMALKVSFNGWSSLIDFTQEGEYFQILIKKIWNKKKEKKSRHLLDGNWCHHPSKSSVPAKSGRVRVQSSRQSHREGNSNKSNNQLKPSFHAETHEGYIYLYIKQLFFNFLTWCLPSLSRSDNGP